MLPVIGGRALLATLGLFVLFAVFHTWPLAAAPASLSRHDNGDAMLNEWAIAWVAHQLPRDPANLFHANIFHPERNTLAFSEHLFVQALLGAPLLWAGAKTTLVHNLLVIAGLALSGWAMCLVMYRWTGDWWAAVLAGLLFAFNAHSLTRLVHLQALHVAFLPVAVYALDRLLTSSRLRHALLLAAAFTLQSLASNYLLVFLVFALIAAAAVRPHDWLLPRKPQPQNNTDKHRKDGPQKDTDKHRRDGPQKDTDKHRKGGQWRVLGLIGLAAAVSIALLFPFLIHYLQAQRDQGLTRSLQEVATYAASWRDYLATGGRLHYEWWSAPFWRTSGAALFPGITAVLLAGVAVGMGVAVRQPAGRMWLAIGLTGVVLSFGAALPGYSLLYEAVPLLQGIRASVRFGYLLLVAVAALAGFGLAWLRADWLRSARWRTGVSLAALVLVTAEAARVPVGYEPAYRIPSIYRLLAAESAAAVVELPFYPPSLFFRNGRYMLNSTFHWRPLVNGYSGFRPESYRRHWEALQGFPDPPTLDFLRDLGVTHIVVHARQFAEDAGEDALEQLAATPDLHIAARSTNVTIYRLAGTRE